MIEYAHEPESPVSMARVLARRGYRPDTIEAAIANSFEHRLKRSFIEEICDEAAKSREHQRILPSANGLLVADEAYREMMEMANREFVARLQMAMAA